jgi:hypothetical protein
VKAKILSGYAEATDGMAAEAADEKKTSPDVFRPYTIQITWRVTFENAQVLSLSGETYSDTGGAHPNGDFQTIVWDKPASRAVLLKDIFQPAQAKAALAAIHDFATRKWVNTVMKESAANNEAVSTTEATAMAGDGAGGADDPFALTYAKGETTANGLVFLYGAGSVWAHVLGDFRISVPKSVFAAYLTPQWKPVFGAK